MPQSYRSLRLKDKITDSFNAGDAQMTTIRTKHNKENKYTIINNRSLWDSTLSFGAVGLWARLLSRPDDWEISVVELQRSSKTGRDKIYRLLNELIEKGYVIRQQTRSTGKHAQQFGKFEYLIFESSADREEYQKSLTLTENPEAETFVDLSQTKCPHIESGPFPDFPDTEKPDVNNTVANTHTLTHKETYKESPPTPRGGANLLISEEAKQLVSLVQEEVKQRNPKAIKLTEQQLSRDRAAAQRLLTALSPSDSGVAPSLPIQESITKAYETAREVVILSLKDEFWGQHITSMAYIAKKWNQLSQIKSHSSQAFVDLNKELAEDFLKINQELYLRNKIALTESGFEFYDYPFSRLIKFTECGFIGKIEDLLKSRKVSYIPPRRY
jgi:hypothetical protein